MKKTVKLLVLIIAASIAYSLESFTCIENTRMTDSSLFKTKEGENLYLEAYAKALTLWPVKYEEVYLKTSYGKAHVVISGPERGSPLVLLHGMYASSTMWYPNIKSLNEKHRTYAIDYIAEPGKSILSKGIRTKEDIVKWYSEVFEKLKLDKFSIIGASRGGWIGVELANKLPKKIDKLILLSPAQTFTMVKPKTNVLKNLYFTIVPEKNRLRSTLKTMCYDVNKLEDQFVEQYYTCMKTMRTDMDFLKMMIYTDQELESLKLPVLVLIGDKDIINNSKSLERAEKLIPNANTEIIKKAGHFLSIDQAEKVNEKVLSFLNKN
ncbi:MAG: ybfK [Bacteroidetes bacterium]|jgi:pimeloyl-ACP methyl ester carboxylesterase|nr:ybfK [Bacteroidota bacterium]